MKKPTLSKKTAAKLEMSPFATEPPPVADVAEPNDLQRKQLSLFQTFYGQIDHDRLSNIIEIWDAAPKYATPNRAASSKTVLMDFLEREFEYKKTVFHMRVAPAAIKDTDGKRIDIFPTAREELVEDALRKIAIQQHLGFVGSIEDKVILGVKFSLKMLQRELSRHGHAITYSSLMQSLMVMSGCQIDITCEGKPILSRGAILSGLEAVNREGYLSDPSSLWSVRFHPMVVSSLSSIAYRQFDYDAAMQYRLGPSRWLYKRLVAVYLNAGLDRPFTIALSTIHLESGLLNHARVRDQAASMLDVLQELKSGKEPIIRDFESKPMLEGRKLVDVHYTLHPSLRFIGHTKATNARQRDSITKLKGVDSESRK
jgi:hypothetical protein